MKAYFIYFILAMFLLIQYQGTGQILFENPDFETSTICDPIKCNETDISCISGWWVYNTSSTIDHAAWVYYQDYFVCEEYDLELESCGGLRGIWLGAGTGGNQLIPATNNPFYSQNPYATYEVTVNVNVFDNIDEEAFIDLYVDDAATGTSGILVGSSGPIPYDLTCHEVKIPIAMADDVLNLTSNPYLIFKIRTPHGHTPTESDIISAVMDGVSACKLVDIAVSQNNCEQVCLVVTPDCPVDCDIPVFNDRELDDCYMDIVWETDEQVILEECYTPVIQSLECCFTPEGPGEYTAQISYQFGVNGEPQEGWQTITVDFQACTTAVVSTDATWSSSNISPYARFDLITVNAGKTLTIEEDLVLHFCQNGKLVIKPGAQVVLKGVLTSSCRDGWKGVEVQGNGTTHQYLQGGGFAQGRLFCRPGSKIENALTAVKLYGPDYDDAGGQIFAEGTSFINNIRGIDIAPYSNFYPTADKQRLYRSSIRDCVFDIDENYLNLLPFTQHIRMYGIFGISILGSSFGYHRHIDGASHPRDYGMGIMAIDAGFNVGAIAEDIEDEPCLPPCVAYKKSTFFGLGHAIFGGRLNVNRPFQVYQSEFENCYFGIANYAVSGCTMLFNEFKLGAIQTLTGHNDQIGIALSSYMTGLTIEENQFYLVDELTDNTIGISVDQIGEVNNVIRKNKFIEITIGNEAFGRNANHQGEEVKRGLHYLCNENEDVSMNDFYIPGTTLYLGDYIRKDQGQYISGGVLAAGNTFSETGDTDDGDFANYGDEELNYYYDNASPIETPSDFEGLLIIDANQNACNQTYCLEPCLDEEGFEDKVDSYYDSKAAYVFAVDEEEFGNAAYYRMKMDSACHSILQYLTYDTLNYKQDSLRAWYLRSQSIAGDLLVAGDFFGAADNTHGNKTLDSIPAHFDLTSDQLTDLRRIKYVYGILATKSPFNLNTTDIDSLHLFSKGIGTSSTLSRSALALIDTIFSPRYYIPGEVTPRSFEKMIRDDGNKQEIPVYPNPTSDILYIDLSEIEGQAITVEFLTLDGQSQGVAILNPGLNKVIMQHVIGDQSGMLIYKIVADTRTIGLGKVLIQRYK